MTVVTPFQHHQSLGPRAPRLQPSAARVEARAMGVNADEVRVEPTLARVEARATRLNSGAVRVSPDNARAEPNVAGVKPNAIWVEENVAFQDLASVNHAQSRQNVPKFTDLRGVLG